MQRYRTSQKRYKPNGCARPPRYPLAVVASRGAIFETMTLVHRDSLRLHRLRCKLLHEYTFHCARDPASNVWLLKSEFSISPLVLISSPKRQ